MPWLFVLPFIRMHLTMLSELASVGHNFVLKVLVRSFILSTVKSFVLLVIGSYLSDHYLFLAVRF